MNPHLFQTESNLHRLLAGREVQSCRAEDLEYFDLGELRDLLLVDEGGALPEVYVRSGDVLRRVEWWLPEEWEEPAP